MALTPSGILNTFATLSDEELKQVAHLEAVIDEYLNQNYYRDGVVTYSIPDDEIVVLNQIRELCRRYRDAGWRVSVVSDGPSFVFIFSKNTFEPSKITQIQGKAN